MDFLLETCPGVQLREYNFALLKGSSLLADAERFVEMAIHADDRNNYSPPCS